MTAAWRVVQRLKRTEDPVAREMLLRTRGTAHAAARGHIRRRRVVDGYLSSTPEPRLHFGAGPIRLPGWLNTDLIAGDAYVNLNRRLPLPDGSFAYAFGEHVIEHLSDMAGDRLLRELQRVLRPGGVLRVTTPDLRKIIAIYEDRNPVVSLDDYRGFLDAETGRPHHRACQVLNDYLRLWGHRWIYDEEDLSARLSAAGFTSIVRRDPGESPHVALTGLERHGGVEWVNQAEAMCLEATRA